jgi:hypothetical protein
MRAASIVDNLAIRQAVDIELRDRRVMRARSMAVTVIGVADARRM